MRHDQELVSSAGNLIRTELAAASQAAEHRPELAM
jgi:hypothetical protein